MQGVLCDTERATDRILVCVTPSGEGATLDVDVESFGITTQLAAGFAYEPPEVSSAEPQFVPAQVRLWPSLAWTHELGPVFTPHTKFETRI